jgi:hypothetical protein
MNKNFNNASKRLAQAGALTLAIASISAPSFAATHNLDFTINVNEYNDPCFGSADFAASWMPDTYVGLTDVNDFSNVGNPGSILVDRGADVAMSVGLGFEDGESCFVPTDPDGTVTATWTMPNTGDVTLMDGTATCVAASPCLAADTNSISATAAVAIDAAYGGINTGSVSIEWIPAD